MNLLNRFELHRYSFYIVTMLTLAGMGSVFRALTRYAKREKLF